MAEAVESALADKKHLIVEAGTGTGKTLAYLVPAILSGKRVVISTGTKNLQEQLFFKDIPFLEKHLGPLRACYMKGRANYACRQKIYDAEKEPVLDGPGRGRRLPDHSRDGRRPPKPAIAPRSRRCPRISTAWAKMDARGELCTGQKCPQFERCFITRMHQKASESDLIIVNHHLFFADLAVKEDERGAIIPDYGAVIFDEAHEMEDVAGQYFGVSISSGQFEELTRDVAGAGASQAVRQRGTGPHPDHAGRARRAVLRAVRRRRGPHRFPLARSVPGRERGSLSRRPARAGNGRAATGAAASARRRRPFRW